MITTALTKRFSLYYPLVLAPMGGVAGGIVDGRGLAASLMRILL